MITLPTSGQICQSRTVRRALIVSALVNIPSGITTATYYLFLTRYGHLSDRQMSLVNLVFFTCLFILEIPTGFMADFFGRKNAVVLAGVFVTIGSFIYGCSHSFAAFALAEAILAVESSLISGAFDAWLNDRLQEEGYTGSTMKPIYSAVATVGKLAGALAALLGGVIGRYGLEKPWFVASAFGLVIAVTAAVLMYEAPYTRRTVQEKVRLIKEGLRYSRTHSTVQFLVVSGVLSVICFQALNMYWPKFFGPLFSGDKSLGPVGFLLHIAMVIGYLRACRFSSDTGAQRALTNCYLGIAACVLLTTLTRSIPWLSLSFFFIHDIGRGLLEGIRRGYANEAIELDEQRAMVSSCASLGRDLGGMIGLPLMGNVIMHASVTTTWIFSALLLGVGTLVSVRIFRAR